MIASPMERYILLSILALSLSTTSWSKCQRSEAQMIGDAVILVQNSKGCKVKINEIGIDFTSATINFYVSTHRISIKS